MKLAELLAERISIEKKLANLSDRIKNNISHVSEIESIESSPDLIELYNILLSRQKHIIKTIMKYNMIYDSEGISISDMLIERDFISKEIGLYTKLMKHIDQQRNPDLTFRLRSENQPIKYEYSIEPIKLQQHLDELHSKFNAVDAKIQARNWSINVD